MFVLFERLVSLVSLTFSNVGIPGNLGTFAKSDNLGSVSEFADWGDFDNFGSLAGFGNLARFGSVDHFGKFTICCIVLWFGGFGDVGECGTCHIFCKLDNFGMCMFAMFF